MEEIIYVGLPCYNEEKDIGQLIDRINILKIELKEKFNLSMKIICVNDGSNDKTESIIKNKNLSEIILINHIANKGLGQAMQTIITTFLDIGHTNDYLVVMDSDNSHNPNYIMDLLNEQKLKKCDIVIASRYQEGALIKGLKKYRELLSNMAKIWYTKMLNIPNVRDYTCGYRLYTYDIVFNTSKKFEENIITQSSFACMMEILYKMYLSGAKISEIPFSLEYNLKMGKSKMKILKTSFNSLITTIKIKNTKGVNK